MSIEKLFIEKNKYEKINKKIKKQKTATSNKGVMVGFALFFISLFISIGVANILDHLFFSVMTSVFGTFIGFILSMFLYESYEESVFKNSSKLKIFSCHSNDSEKFAKKYKKELKIYEKESYKDLFMQTLNNKIKNADKNEILKNGINIKKYILGIDKEYKKEKKAMEKLIEKKLHSIDKIKKDEKRLSELLQVDSLNKETKTNIIQNL